MYGFDEMVRWAQGSLGPKERWPDGVAAALELCAAMPVPAAILWSRELTFFPNGALAAVLGGDVESLVARPLDVPASADDGARVEGAIAALARRVFDQRARERLRVEAVRAGTPPRALALSASPLALGAAPDAEPRAVLVVVEDDSVRTDAEARIAAIERAQLEDREQMFAVVAHDLKNPLNVISLSIYQLAMPAAPIPPELRERWKKPIDAIKRSTWRINDIISDMLDLARLDVGPIVVDREVHDSTKLVGEVLEHMIPIAQQKQVQLEPAVEPGLTISCDKERFMRVLASLLNDALVASPQHGMVRLAGRLEGDWVTYEIHDMGPGIPPEERARLFDRRQARRKDERRKLGRGLPLAKALVEAQGGRLTVDTPIGLGMIVRLFFPAV
ncbi:HAMP domain-containing histidine kinase [Myxococcota bacterium]|nr:HAMP domain-containing histidine kinase [Myxococcota bacterium]